MPCQIRIKSASQTHLSPLIHRGPFDLAIHYKAAHPPCSEPKVDSAGTPHVETQHLNHSTTLPFKRGFGEKYFTFKSGVISDPLNKDPAFGSFLKGKRHRKLVEHGEIPWFGSFCTRPSYVLPYLKRYSIPYAGVSVFEATLSGCFKDKRQRRNERKPPFWGCLKRGSKEIIHFSGVCFKEYHAGGPCP